MEVVSRLSRIIELWYVLAAERACRVFSSEISLSFCDIANYRLGPVGRFLFTHASLFAFGEKFHEVSIYSESSSSLSSSDHAERLDGFLTSLTGNSSSSES